MPPRKAAAKSKSKKGKESATKIKPQAEPEEQPIEEQPVSPQDGDPEQDVEMAGGSAEGASLSSIPGSSAVSEIISTAAEFVEKMTDPPTEPAPSSMTIEERTNKLKALQSRMRQSAQANRADLIAESQQLKTNARDAARREKQRKLHETLRLKADAEERGEDAERAKNWEYTIEENDEWEKRLKRKKTRADFEFHDDAHAARRKYKKDLDHLNPDLAAYNAQKEAALGYAPGTLTNGTSSPGAGPANLQVATVSHQQQLAAENLYRDANSLLYADSQPSEEAIDRVVSKMNLDLDKRGKRSRKRLHEDDGDITYINERNRVFNKKIARYYDKYTSEIRASFERGTAL